METKRRDLLLGVPLGLLGLELWNGIASAQDPDPAQPDPGVVDFWVKQMGVAPHKIPGGELLASGAASRDLTATNSGYGREPLFYFLDEKAAKLIPAKEIDDKNLMPGGDTKIEWSMQKLRLNPDDQKQFARYSSGGIYMDFQQHESNTEALSKLASATFTAIFPGGKLQNPLVKKKGSAGKTGSDAGSPPKTSGAAGSVPLQSPGQSQTQSIALPGGIGKVAFACFAKDRKQSAFGMFVTSIVQATNSPMASVLSLLAMPVVAGPALQALRGLVGALQSHGRENQWILKSGPSDVAATADGAKSLKGCLRIANGTYIVIPKEHGAALDPLDGWKTIDGFLVRQNQDERMAYQASISELPGVTYLSIVSKVSKAKLKPCLLG
jgi:hypothetical protein